MSEFDSRSFTVIDITLLEAEELLSLWSVTEPLFCFGRKWDLIQLGHLFTLIVFCEPDLFVSNILYQEK